MGLVKIAGIETRESIGVDAKFPSPISVNGWAKVDIVNGWGIMLVLDGVPKSPSVSQSGTPQVFDPSYGWRTMSYKSWEYWSSRRQAVIFYNFPSGVSFANGTYLANVNVIVSW